MNGVHMPLVICRSNNNIYSRKLNNVLFESKVSSRITSSQILLESEKDKENIKYVNQLKLELLSSHNTTNNDLTFISHELNDLNSELNSTTHSLK